MNLSNTLHFRVRAMASVGTILLGLILPSSTLIAQENWDLKLDREGIQVYIQEVSGSPYDATLSVTVIEDVRLASLVALIEDVEACPNWADRCKESYLYERISPVESLIYTNNHMPFPFKDRDVLARIIWTQDQTSGEVIMTSTSANGILAEVRGRHRLIYVDVNWKFLPLSSGAIEVSNFVHVDPGFLLPAWLTNRLIVETPFETMEAFRTELAKPKYRNAQIDFISEPSTL